MSKSAHFLPHNLDAELMAGAREAEGLLRRLGKVVLISLSSTRRGETLVYWLEAFPGDSLVPVRDAFRHLFYRNDVRSYFFGMLGYLTDDNDSRRISVAGNVAGDRQEVMFYVASDGEFASQAYSLVTRDDEGRIAGLSVLHAMPVTRQGPFFGLLNPIGASGLNKETYILAEQLDRERLLFGV